MSLKATVRNGQWLSGVYNQEPADNAWVSCSTTVEGRVKSIELESATTSTTITTYDINADIQANDVIITSSNGTLTEVTVEGVLDTTSTITNMLIVPSRSGSSIYDNIGSGTYSSTPYGAGTGFFSRDGMRVWFTSGDGVGRNNILQADLSEPYNMESTVTYSGSYNCDTTSSAMCWNWANKGQYFIASSPAIGQYFRWTARVPYDISTLVDPINMKNNDVVAAGAAFDTPTAIAFSDDGYRWIMYDGIDTAIRSGTTEVPFDFINVVTDSNRTIASHGTVCIYEGADHWLHYYNDATVSFIDIYSMTTQADDSTTSYTRIPVTNIVDSSSNNLSSYIYIGTSNFNSPVFITSHNLKHLIVSSQAQTVTTFNGVSTFNDHILIALESQAGTKRQIDISTQGLSTAPDKVYIKTPPTISIASSPTSYTTTSNERLYMYSSNTTSATIISSVNNLLSNTTPILLDGTTSVTPTSVAVANSTIKTFTDSARYRGSKNLNTSQYVWASTTKSSWGPHFTFSSDGVKLFVYKGSSYITGNDYSAGVYIFDLTTPWEISTAVPSSRPIFEFFKTNRVGGTTAVQPWNSAWNYANYTPNSTATYNACGMYWSDDGYIVNFLVGSSYRIQITTLTLSEPWNLFSNYTVNAFNSVLMLPGGSTYATPRDIIFNKSGSYAYVIDDYNATSSATKYIFGASASTNFNAGSIPTSSFSTITTSATGAFLFRLTPDGGRTYGLGVGPLSDSGVGYGLKYKNNTINGEYEFTPTGQTFDVSFPEAANITGIGDHRFSNDGLKWYVLTNSGIMHQYDVMQGVAKEYTVTFAEQASAPTSIYLPDQSSQITLSSNSVTNVGNTCYANIVYTSNSTNITGSRSLRVKMSGNVSKSNFIDTIRLDLTKES